MTSRQKKQEQEAQHIILGAFALTVFTLMFWAFTGSLGWGVGLAWAIVLFIASPFPNDKQTA